MKTNKCNVLNCFKPEGAIWKHRYEYSQNNTTTTFDVDTLTIVMLFQSNNLMQLNTEHLKKKNNPVTLLEYRTELWKRMILEENQKLQQINK